MNQLNYSFASSESDSDVSIEDEEPNNVDERNKVDESKNNLEAQENSADVATKPMPFNPKAYGKGFNMLSKMGYKGGGLGKDGKGRVEPIIVTSVKGKQVDATEPKKQPKAKASTQKLKSPEKISDPPRWSRHSTYFTNIDDAKEKCEDFIKNLYRGKAVKVELSKKNESISSIINNIILQTCKDLADCISKKTFEQQKLERESKSISESKRKLDILSNRIEQLESLASNFNLDVLLSFDDFETNFDYQELAASYLSKSIATLKPEDFTDSPKKVLEVYHAFNSPPIDTIHIKVKKRLYEYHVVKPLAHYFKGWNVESVEEGLDVYTKWDSFKSLSTLVLDIITSKITYWLDNLEESNFIPPHLIIHPWLLYLTEPDTIYESLVKMFYRLIQTSDDLLIPAISEFSFLKSGSAAKSFKDLLEFLRDKFKGKLASPVITFDMSTLLSLINAMFKSQLYSNEVLATDLSPLALKYSKTVRIWIDNGEVDNVIESYQAWSEALSPVIDHPRIKPHFLSILRAMDPGDDTAETEIKIPIDKHEKPVVVAHSVSSGKNLNLFEYISNIAMKKGIELKPKVGRLHDGKQVYSFGKVLIVVERLLIHALIDKKWKPVDIDQLLKLS